MKKILLLLILVSGSLFSQTISLSDEKFNTYLNNGDGTVSNISFTINGDTQTSIMNSESYKRFLNDEIFIKANFEKRNTDNPLAVYLFSEINSASSSTRLKLKNKTSYKIIDNSVGSIRLTPENTIKITFPFTAKNDLGNELIKKSINYDSKTIFID